jgi:hypothetical protein
VCPHLYSAWLFDHELCEFSNKFAERKIDECSFAPYINNENELKQVIAAIDKRVI